MTKRKLNISGELRFRDPKSVEDIKTNLESEGVDNARSINFRAIRLQPKSIKVAENGEVSGTAVIASTYPVQREIYVKDRGWVIVDEILDIQGINLERGDILPLQIDHSQSVRNQIGDWTNIRIDPADSSQMIADFRVSPDDECKAIRERIAGGYIKTFSCAYFITRYTLEEDEEGKITLRVNECELYEVSAVAMPADPRSKSRSLEGVDDMSVRGKKKTGNEGTPSTPAAERSNVQISGSVEGNEIENELDESEDEVEAELEQRSAETDASLTARARSLGIPAAFLKRHLGSGISVREFTSEWRAYEAERNARQSRETQVRQDPIAGAAAAFGQRTSQNQVIGRAFAAFDMARATGTPVQLDEATARSLTQAMPNVDLTRGVDAKSILRTVAARHNVGYLIPNDLDEGSVRSAFQAIRAVAPAVLADFANIIGITIQSMQPQGPELIPYWGTNITRRVNFNDYQSGRFYTPLASEAMRPLEDGGEIPAVGLNNWDTEGQLAPFGARWALSRILFGGSGTTLFNDLNTVINNSATTTENTILQKKLITNPIMGKDNLPFFNGDRFNVATGVPISPEGLNMIQAAAFSQGEFSPFVYALCNPVNQLALARLNATVAANKISEVNPFGGTFQVVPVPGMPVDAVMWIRDPRVKAAFLRMVRTGQETPIVSVYETAQYDGLEVKAVMDRGVAHGDPQAAFLAFTGDEPDALPNGDVSNYDALPIEDVIKARNSVDFSND